MGDFCAICGKPREGHPTKRPGPPNPPPPPGTLSEGAVWRPSHDFHDSGLTVAELLDERDAQIKLWQRRAWQLRHWIDRIPDKPSGWADPEAPAPTQAEGTR